MNSDETEYLLDLKDSRLVAEIRKSYRAYRHSHARDAGEFLAALRRSTDMRGTPGRELLKFTGSIDQADLDMMSDAIRDACEKIEPNGK